MKAKRWNLAAVFFFFVASFALSACSSNAPEHVDATDPTQPVVCLDLSPKRSQRPVGDLYVSKAGNDANDGRSYETAFATVQKGVDALQAGQTLIIAPGEYFESVHRGTFIQWEYANGLGSPDVDTIIRAEIPGTAVLRGDVPAPTFRKLDGYRFVWEADVEPGMDIHVVNELDTLKVLPKKVGIQGLDYLPGAFVHDKEDGKLYLSSTDFKPADAHRYSLSVIQDHGFALVDATRVIVDGLTVTGFNMSEAIYGWSDFTSFSVWGIFVTHSRKCEIRNTRTYLNARGIGITDGDASKPNGYGSNIVDGAMSWANDSPISTEDTGGITLTNPRGDVVRNSLTYLNGGVGINIYGEAEDATGKRFELSNNLAWGNEYADYKIKGNDYYSVTNSVGLGAFSHSCRPKNCLIGGSVHDAKADSIVFSNEADLDLNAEFADPANHDFRLQSTSRFRSAKGKPGPFPYKDDVFFISPDGDDSRDGLSVASAWKTFAHAEKKLRPGDTLYVEGAVYDEDVLGRFHGKADAPIKIRGRGEEPARLSGQWQLVDARHVDLQRLSFEKMLAIEQSVAVTLDNCFLLASDKGLWAVNNLDLRVTHSTFTGFEDTAIDLSCSVDAHIAGNLFDNGKAHALLISDVSAVRYANYNSYGQSQAAWSVAGSARSFATIQETQEPQSKQLIADFDLRDDRSPRLNNALDFAFGGSFGQPFGTFRPTIHREQIRLIDEAHVHSVSSTTANIQWMTSVPVEAELSWGDTPAMSNTIKYLARPYATLSLTDLTPSTTYYFKVESLSIPSGVEIDAEPLTPSGEALSFVTLASDPEPRTYFVAKNGDNTNDGLSQATPWQTLQHAADRVGVGDTVRIGGGEYAEQVYIKASGCPERPITFENMPSERVTLLGAKNALSNAFVITGKTDLHFDGLYFTEYGDNNRWAVGFIPLWGGDFNIYRSKDISISRSFFSGDDFQLNGIVAHYVDGVRLDNTVFLNHFQALHMYHVSSLAVEHSVIARPWLFVSIIYYADAYTTPLLPEQFAQFKQCIFTDNFKSKADQNLKLFYGQSGIQTQCVYALRDEHDPNWRKLDNDSTAFEAPDRYIEPIFDDPQFAGVEALKAAGESIDFSADGVMREGFIRNFDSFYATNPAVSDLGIGLQTDRFDDQGVPN